jgi:glycine hydroxymethyltransferase
MGLIAGGAFQPDVLNYVDVLFGSTHKSFFGPQGGIILTNDEEIIEAVRRNITWRAMDNYNPSRLASLGVAMEEMRQYGKDYARKVVKNSFDLAKSLSNAGLAPRFSPWFTETHQILLSETSLLNLGTNFEGFSNILERNYIVVDREGRIGTSEISRLGIDEVEEIGELIVSALKGNDVSKRVKEIRREAKIHYCEVVE